MAVPTGDYEVTARIDLSYHFGVIEQTETLHIETPGPDVLEKRIAALDDEDVEVRRQALVDLRYFPERGDVVVPALVGVLEDPEPMIRMVALSVLMAYPVEAAQYGDLFLRFLREGESVSERANAAWLLSRLAPADDEVEEALRHAAESEEGPYRARFTSALEAYLARTRAGAED